MEENYIEYCTRTKKNPWLKTSLRKPEDMEQMNRFIKHMEIKDAVRALKKNGISPYVASMLVEDEGNQ